MEKQGKRSEKKRGRGADLQITDLRDQADNEIIIKGQIAKLLHI